MITLHESQYYYLIMTQYCWIDPVHMLLFLWLIHKFFQWYNDVCKIPVPKGGINGVHLSRSV